MKGRTTCPNCDHRFVIDIDIDKEEHEIVCPNCNHKFHISTDTEKRVFTEGNFSWEEHGEPRKTILSAIKQKTRRPIIAAILLICVFSIGVSTTVFSEVFIESTMDIASSAGFTGDIEIEVIDVTNQRNTTLSNVTVTINNQVFDCEKNGEYYRNGIEPGIHTVIFNKSNYTDKKVEILILPFIDTKSTISMKEGTDQEVSKFNTFGCSIILGIFSVFALIGMISCLKRNHIDLAIAGSFLGIFSFGFFFIGSILSIIAFIVILRSRDEFENGKAGKIF